MIEQKDGDRHFSYWRENSAARLLAEDSKVLQAGFEGQALIYFSGITLAILSVGARLRIQDALKSAKSAGTRIAFDPNLRPSLWNDSNEMRATIESSAVISDIILPSYDDEAEHFGDADPAATCERYANLAGDGAEIIVKNGAEAVTIRHRGENVSFAVPSIKNIVDATGAGDAFNGGYFAARLMGRTRHEATSTAIRTSARVVSHHGAITR
jgi:2-dehydro-3-deoxygluconokinase